MAFPTEPRPVDGEDYASDPRIWGAVYIEPRCAFPKDWRVTPCLTDLGVCLLHGPQIWGGGYSHPNRSRGFPSPQTPHPGGCLLLGPRLECVACTVELVRHLLAFLDLFLALSASTANLQMCLSFFC